MNGEIVGNYKDTIQHPQYYFHERGCFVDCRGNISIDKTTVFGYGVKMLSQAHDISTGDCGVAVNRNIQIDGNSWIASFAILYACWIQSHAVVSCGSVVSGVIVPSYTMVQGNPAKVVAVYKDNKWNRLETPIDCKSWLARK